jgi:hypothetical protein
VGTWGPGIFSSDAAEEVRDEWREALMDGLDDEAATARVLATYSESFDDHDEKVVSWTALAAAQMQTGRLQPHVRDTALKLIDAGGDLELWEDDPAGARRRAKALEKLAAELRGPQPAPKTLKRPRPQTTKLEIGDVVHIRGERAEAHYVVVELVRYSYGICPVVAELLWDGGEIPDHETLARLPLLHEEVFRNEATRPVQHFWSVDDPSRGKRALSNFGLVVARGVLRPDAADVLRDQSRGFADGPTVSGSDWEGMAAFLGGPWHRRLVETTRRLNGR